MIHEEAGGSGRRQGGDGDFVFPCYEGKCISNIPGTVLGLFGVESERRLPVEVGVEVDGVDKVVLFVLDGFGYNQFLRFCGDNRFLVNLAEKGGVFPVTSVFPSQTTNALTTLNTGLTPQEHGLFEYYLYLKEVDRIVSTLSFEPLGYKRRNELVDRGFDPKLLFKGGTIQNTLREAGVKTFVHIYVRHTYSAYSKVIFDGSTIVPNFKSSDLVVNLRKTLEKEKGPAYFFVHLSNLDTIAHEYGPQSYEYSTELSVISYLLQKELVEKIDQQTAKETLLLMTSDHGGVRVVPQDTTYLNEFPQVVKNLRCGRGGKRILPTGSPRDVFLHVREEKLRETKELLAQKIGDKAKIVETEETIKAGLFGLGEVRSEFSDRVGNLLILPYRNETVWFEHIKGIRFNLLGHHGGLTEKEMLVPLAIAKLSNLK
ncbi:MAG: alkaline phosphatase family protein [Candidatus Bathyarchaeota archaeon]|jgi:predicted AlkP superfamily pyrophosphatase or phosphodiesterase